MKRYDFIPGCITFVEGRDYPIPGAESEDGLFVLYDDAMAEIAEEKKLKIFWHAMADAAEAKIAVLKAELDAPKFDLVKHLHRQRSFSLNTFGPGLRTLGVLDHIRKELLEIEVAPHDVTEWVDVVLLALDGAWRAGHEPEDIAKAITDKQARNEARHWPDWRAVENGKAIEHIREDKP